MSPLPVGVLASGEGTNLQALLDTVHGREAEVVAVASDKPDARALARAQAAGVPAAVFALDEHPDRDARDAAIADWLQERGVRARRARRLHGDPHARVPGPLPARGAQRPPVPAAGVPRHRLGGAGGRLRGPGLRRDGAPRGRGRRHRPDRAPGRRRAARRDRPGRGPRPPAAARARAAAARRSASSRAARSARTRRTRGGSIDAVPASERRSPSARQASSSSSSSSSASGSSKARGSSLVGLVVVAVVGVLLAGAQALLRIVDAVAELGDALLELVGLRLQRLLRLLAPLHAPCRCQTAWPRPLVVPARVLRRCFPGGGGLTPSRRQGAGLCSRAITPDADIDPAVSVTAPGAVRVRRALLSVSDKTGIVDFARGLAGSASS